ncbi:hypothetical protein Y032_0131g1647 [Ancylostoma ceylanicum]|uniref:Ribosomal RNA-processing protein 8 n=1 Tax=Ancylostoma ceylanicum TaxID=53326 RepID=A0A016T751_9BILA|nr:hypothetical protein Y032_0131g1647 [Ancylostoma ceylanicum]
MPEASIFCNDCSFVADFFFHCRTILTISYNLELFRFLNEQLYTMTGSEALEYFRQDPNAFRCYHNGFAEQVWFELCSRTICHRISFRFSTGTASQLRNRVVPENNVGTV